MKRKPKTVRRFSRGLRSLFFTFVLGAVATAVLSGCSVDMFSGDRHDREVGEKQDYRKIRPECSKLKLDRKDLDGAALRSIVECLNSNKAIPEIASLAAEASAETLNHTANLIQTGFFSDQEALAQSRAIVHSLARTSAWESHVSSFRYLFSDANRLRSMIHLLSNSHRETPMSDAISRMNPQETYRAWEMLSRLVNSRAFQSLQKGILDHPLSVTERARLLELVSKFVSSKSALQSARSVFSDLLAGKSSSLWTYALGPDSASSRNPEVIRASTLRLRNFLDDLGKNDGAHLRGLARLHQGFHHPISCWGQGKVFNSPWKNLTEELRAHSGDRLLPFIARFATLTAVGVRDLCEIPSGFYDYYGASLSLTSGRSGGAYVAILDRAVLGGMGESAGYFVGEWGEPLSEALAILREQPWFSDLILTLAELDAADREALAYWFSDLSNHIDRWEAFARSWTPAEIDRFFSDFGIVFGGDVTELGRLFDSVLSLFESSRAHPWFFGWKKIFILDSKESLEPLTRLEGFPLAVSALDEMARDGRLASMLADIFELLSGKSSPVQTQDVGTAESSIRRPLRHAYTGKDLDLIPFAAGGFDGVEGIERGPRVEFDPSLLACTRLNLRKRPAEQWADFSLCAGISSSDGLEKVFASSVSGNQTSGEDSFFDRFIRSWAILPLPKESKHDLIALLTGARGYPAFRSEDLRSVSSFLREYLRTDPADKEPSLARSGFKLLSRMSSDLSMGRAEWDSVFRRIGDFVGDARFAPVLNAIRRMSVPGDEASKAPLPVTRPDSLTTHKWIDDFECERDPVRIQVRANEIAHEFDEAVFGWRYKNGRLPTQWDSQDLHRRVQKIAHTLRSDSLRSGIYAFLRRNDGKNVATWFMKRASDARPVALMDPETKMLRVRWMTSLDRLESILVNSNFQYVLPTNYGLKFIGRFAEAWGDEPRSKWPAEVQARYRGWKRPPTLAEVYEEVEQFLDGFERVGGLPQIPSCVPKDGGASGVKLDRPWASAPDVLIPFELKAKAFNLRQTLSVIRENLPDSGDENADGMRFLRDLFWAVYSSAPASDRDARTPARNLLRVLQELGDLGGLRQISRGFQSIRSAGELGAVEDAWNSASRLVMEPAFDQVLEKALSDSHLLSSWITRWTSVNESRFDPFVIRTLSLLASDHSLGLLPGFARIAQRALDGFQTGSAALPSEVVLDALDLAALESGSRIQSLRAVSSTDLRKLSEARSLFERRVEPIVESLPLMQLVRLLEKESPLRQELVAAWRLRRQTHVEANSAVTRSVELFLSESEPAFRSMIGLWCGKNGGQFVDGFAKHPHESILIIDGILRVGETGGLADFVDALLRQLPH